MAANRSVCPRCRRAYSGPVRVCMVDGTPLVDEERLAEIEERRARDATTENLIPPPPGRSDAQRRLTPSPEGPSYHSPSRPAGASRVPTPRPFPVPIPGARIDEVPHTN